MSTTMSQNTLPAYLRVQRSRCQRRAGKQARSALLDGCEAVTGLSTGALLSYTTATLTQWMGGKAGKRHSHFSPPSRPIQSWPVVVPK